MCKPLQGIINSIMNTRQTAETKGELSCVYTQLITTYYIDIPVKTYEAQYLQKAALTCVAFESWMNACLAHFQYKLAATSVLTCLVCLARGILGKRVQTARGDVGTQ